MIVRPSLLCLPSQNPSPLNSLLRIQATKHLVLPSFFQKKRLRQYSLTLGQEVREAFFVYDEHFDCYLCPENQVLTYRTTTREGYREYKSNPEICKTFPLLAICTESRQHQKVVVRHIWKDALEICEDIRHQSGMKERYQHRKETIERLFGTAKEYHNLRYTREKGKSKMEDKVGLTLACLNIKKLVKMMAGKTCYFTQITQYY